MAGSIEKISKDRALVPLKKAELPRLWKVVFSVEAGSINSCNTCLLMEVFHLSVSDAARHVIRARRTGSSIVLESTREVSEQKANDANNAKSDNTRFCRPSGSATFFEAKPV